MTCGPHVPADHLPRRRPAVHFLRVPRGGHADHGPPARPGRDRAAIRRARDRRLGRLAGDAQGASRALDARPDPDADLASWPSSAGRRCRRAARAHEAPAAATTSVWRSSARPRRSRATASGPTSGPRSTSARRRHGTTSASRTRCWPRRSSTSRARRSRERPARRARSSTARRPSTSGYYRDEDATREAFRDGWFHSGDCCRYDEDGLRVMVDRYKDIVKSGGENVSSAARRGGAVVQHPAVANGRRRRDRPRALGRGRDGVRGPDEAATATTSSSRSAASGSPASSAPSACRRRRASRDRRRQGAQVQAANRLRRGLRGRLIAKLLAQLGAADLAADRLGQLVDEVDLARVLVRRGQLACVVLQLASRARRTRLTARRQDDERADDLRALRIVACRRRPPRRPPGARSARDSTSNGPIR